MDEMIALLDGHLPCFLFEKLFLDQLPEDMRLILADADYSDPRSLATKADDLLQARTMSQNEVCKISKK